MLNAEQIIPEFQTAYIGFTSMQVLTAGKSWWDFILCTNYFWNVIYLESIDALFFALSNLQIMQTSTTLDALKWKEAEKITERKGLAAQLRKKVLLQVGSKLHKSKE